MNDAIDAMENGFAWRKLHGAEIGRTKAAKASRALSKPKTEEPTGA